MDARTSNYIYSLVGFELGAEVERQNRTNREMSRFRDRCTFVNEKIQETDAKLTAEVDEIADRLTALPDKAKVAFSKARATLDGFDGGLDDIEAGLNILSNSDPLAGSENVSGVSDPTKPA